MKPLTTTVKDWTVRMGDKSAAPAQAQHSPLPWFVTRGNEIGFDGKDANGNRHVGYVAETIRRNQYGRADAAYIVRACNNAQRLSDELERCRDLLIGYKTAFPNHFADLDARFGADAVIKSAYQALQDFGAPNPQKGGTQ